MNKRRKWPQLTRRILYTKALLKKPVATYRLPVDDLDILIVDEIGKNISGTGMDTNVMAARIRSAGAGITKDQESWS